MFFYTAKLLWFLLQPSTLLIALVVGGFAVLMCGHIRAAKACLMLAGLIGLAALSPLPNVLTLPLEERFTRPSLEGAQIAGIVILGGGEDADVAEGRGAHALNEAGERITEAVAISRRFPSARIVFSGGSGKLGAGHPSEASVVARMLIGMGVAAERLTLEDRSRDTFENAQLTRALLTPAAGERWLLVTSATHMPRAMGVFRKAGFALEPWPVDYRTRGGADAAAPFSSAADGLRRLDVVGREYVGLVAYWLTARSDELWPGPGSGTRHGNVPPGPPG